MLADLMHGESHHDSVSQRRPSQHIMLKWMLPAVTGALMALIVPKLLSVWSPSHWSFSSFCLGIGATLLLTNSSRLVKRSRSAIGKNDDDGKLYGLEHGLLHLQVSPSTWWMNMGYWKDPMTGKTIVGLSDACYTLLLQVLTRAHLISSTRILVSGERSHSLVENVSILDVGFGCGDQTKAIRDMGNNTSYIGITLDKQQFNFAKNRGLEQILPSRGHTNIQLFQADAASPAIWPADLQDAVRRQFDTTSLDGAPTSHRRWLLALDTLYHFKPSRQPLFAHTHDQLQASIVAFDLLLSEEPYFWFEHMLLRISCALSSTPYSNFLTRQQYEELLVSVGYHKDKIEITDISQHVFAPLARFLEHHDQQLQVLGLSIGKFRAAKWLFSWWGRSGIVRGCIVVANR